MTYANQSNKISTCNLVFLPAAGHQEDSPTETPLQIDIQGIDLDSLWNSSLEIYSVFSEHYPSEMEVETSLTDQNYNEILSQNAELRQSYEDAELKRDISEAQPITPLQNGNGPESRPEGDQSGMGGMNSSRGGGGGVQMSGGQFIGDDDRYS